MLTWYQKHWPKYITGPISNERTGQKSLFVCNNMETIRVKDRLQGERLLQYYRRKPLIEGDITSFWSLRHIRPGELSEGIMNLTGELPAYTNDYSTRFFTRARSACDFLRPCPRKM